jgi:predicted Zn-dependent protease with MMP-like domain
MDAMIAMSAQRFDDLVQAAFDRIPEELAAMLENVVLLVEDDAPAEDPDLLGLYDGTPLTERDSQYGGVLPDRILIFRNPTLRMCSSEDEVIAEVAVTVAHEIAHHFGIDDDRLDDLGYA